MYETWKTNNIKDYTINCNYYKKSFNNVNELINDIIITGQDPNYNILLNGKQTGEQVIDLITF
tara:strand:+ start:558 stop:746 length:189 start_codon:yes stop_codon:yes gene_type:complete